VKISNKKFSFFSSRNQYFPHIPYVASKKINIIFKKTTLEDFKNSKTLEYNFVRPQKARSIQRSALLSLGTNGMWPYFLRFSKEKF
jgi:hypothetical protein